LVKFADASILVAVLIREDGYEDLVKQLEAAKPVLISPISKWEATVKLARVTSPALAAKQIDQLLKNIEAKMISMDEAVYDLAFDAWVRYGKGRHGAKLNMGDCFAYACARANKVPLLFVGNDFPKSDIKVVS
jgi:ribonuclease VapC